MKILKGFLLLIFVFTAFNLYSQNNFAVSINYTPVLNTPDYETIFGGKQGNRVKLDDQGLIREMEYIALPNTVFEIIEVLNKGDHDLYRVISQDYPYKGDYYIDARFVRVVDTEPETRKKILPTKEEIIKNMNALEGYQYMWGGNAGDGISEMLSYYPPKSEINEQTKSNWMMKGVDCSGLIYQSTNGATPRNTSTLCLYGNAVEIEKLSAEDISKKLQPLDIIVWSGHVIIVLDESTVIESTPAEGVHKSDLTSRLKSVMKERTAVNDWASTTGKRFVVRRWAEKVLILSNSYLYIKNSPSQTPVWDELEFINIDYPFLSL